MVTKNLAVIITARAGSSRLPNKAMAKVGGKYLIQWIIERLQKATNQIVLAVPATIKDFDEFSKLQNRIDVPIFYGHETDVITRISQAVKEHFPDAKFIMRGLGDCPFIEPDFIQRATSVMERTSSEAFLWHSDPATWPVYGAREFPYHISAWNKIVRRAKDDEREHVDLYFHRHRNEFKIAYHEPPSSHYYRNYRLEVDWPEDLTLVQEIAKNVEMLSPLTDIIKFLDANPKTAKLNRERVEKTGPMTSYEYNMRRTWMKDMIGKAVVGWNDSIWNPPDERSIPIFCNNGKCLIGFGWSGTLFRDDGTKITGEAYIACKCGAGKYWKKAHKRN